jgi:phosphotriesterase-related protein
MPVTTVTGPKDANALGIILPHEHLFIDLRNQFSEFDDLEKRRISHLPVGAETLGALRSNPYAVKDNLLLDDMEIAVAEVLRFKAVGGGTIVDCTISGIERDARKLRELSLRTGVNVIAGCGYYTYDTHPAEMAEWSPEEIAAQMVRELTVGIDGTGIKAGVIGEIGTSQHIHPNERKVLLAAALAFKETGAPVYVHTYPWGRIGLEVAELLLGRGVDPTKLVICHTDVEPDVDYILALLRLGAWIEFDNFGKEFDIDPVDRAFAGGIFISDRERVHLLRRLVERGYAGQLLLTNDICLKQMLHAYGGNGYDHILRNIAPMMRDEGISPEIIDCIIRENPRQLFGN